MPTTMRRLLELIKSRSFQFGDFVLASGEPSRYYVDLKMCEVFPESAFLIGEAFYENTKDLDFDAIGGLEVGAVPLVSATVISCFHHGREVEGFWVRQRPKDHGTRKMIEGGLRNGSRVVILDDVVTTGSSTSKAIDEAKKCECEVVRIVSLVDRLQGARESFESKYPDIEYQSIFTVRDFGIEPNVRNKVTFAVG